MFRFTREEGTDTFFFMNLFRKSINNERTETISVYIANFPMASRFFFSSSLRPGFEGCSEIMNDPLYLRFVCLEQDEIFPEY